MATRRLLLVASAALLGGALAIVLIAGHAHPAVAGVPAPAVGSSLPAVRIPSVAFVGQPPALKKPRVVHRPAVAPAPTATAAFSPTPSRSAVAAPQAAAPPALPSAPAPASTPQHSVVRTPAPSKPAHPAPGQGGGTVVGGG
jgi:hypothetical protein